MRGDTMFSDTVRMEISRAYNLYNEGTITLEQRESMIQEAKDQEYRESVFDIDSIDPYLSPTEQLQEIKKLCYEKCAAGEISVFERERLVNEYTEAYKDKIYTEMTVSSSSTVDGDVVASAVAGAAVVIVGFKSINHLLLVAQRSKIYSRYPELKDCGNRIKNLQKTIRKEYRVLSKKNRQLSREYNRNYKRLQVDTSEFKVSTNSDGDLTVKVDNDYSMQDRNDLSRSEKKQQRIDIKELAEVQNSLKILNESINELKFLNKKMTRIIKRAAKTKRDIPEQDIVELRKAVEKCEKLHWDAKRKGRV